VITFDQALEVFLTQAEMARAFGVERASVSDWKKKGVLPDGRVWQLIALRPDKFGHLHPNAPQGNLELVPAAGT
jgi:hypothetical protein